MAGKLSFSIAINLLTEQFKRGANQVKASFRSMQMQAMGLVAALGAGSIGLSELMSRMIETAKETNRAQTALKNVSGGAAVYAGNLRYIMQMSRKYGIELNTLTSNYAKFTAAATSAGVGMDEQKKIFESVSRAVAAFSLNREDSNGVFLGLSQMMSKGKVSAEELRLQIGERLPIAFQAMARAAGTSMAGLDKMMKDGKAISAELVPKFAAELEKMIPAVDTDNLNTSLNRLQNTFTSLVERLNVQGIYKSIVDSFNGALKAVRDGVAGITAFVISMVGGRMLKGIMAFFVNIDAGLRASVTKAELAEFQKQKATEARIAAEQRLEVAKTSFENAENDKRLTAYIRMQNAEQALKRAVAAEERAVRAASQAAESAAAARSINTFGRIKNVAIGALASIGKSLKALFSATWPMALITAVSALIGYFVNLRKEAQRIKSLFSDYKKELDVAGNTAEVSMMQKQLEIMNDRSRKQEEINAAQARLQSMLGGEKLTQEEINKKVAERVALLKEAATAELAATKIAETEEKNRELARGLGIDVQELDFLSKFNGKERNDLYIKQSGNKYYQDGVIGLYRQVEDERKMNSAVNEYLQNQKILNDATDRLAASQDAVAKVQALRIGNTTTDGNSVQTELQKQQARYAAALRELEARRKVEAMTVDEYNKAYADINKDALITALSTDDQSVSGSDWAKGLAVEYRNTMAKVTAATVNQALDEMHRAMEKEEQPRAGAVPVIGRRDTTFDYKKTGTDKLAEDVDIWKNYKQGLQELANEEREVFGQVSELVQDELNKAIANVDSLEDALKLSQVQDDIRQLQREIDEGIYSGIKDIASSGDRLVSAFENVREVMNDVDASGWERVMAVWNAMINTVDAFNSIVHTIENISALTAKLSGAKEAEKGLKEQAGKTVATKAVEIGADMIATQTAVDNSKRKSEAAVAEMASKSTAAYAGIPFAGAGLAAAQIATMLALIEGASAKVPGFANGGIYTKGTAFGDKGLARMNRGEMVLTMAQQSRLFNAISTGSLGTVGGELSSTVATDISGDKLRLIINNSLKSKGKKPIL